MEKKRVFPTGSSYEGSWESSICALNGFGTYLYPDLTEYRGYFQNGKFHGYGRLRLAAPHKFTVEGHFQNGVLKDIAYMWFHDGLTVNTSLSKNNKLDFNDWKYCCEEDRRYVRELIYGLEPVNPKSPYTAERKPRTLEKDAFDTEEGVFKETTGFLTDGVQPFKYSRYVECNDEKDWILEHCRRAEADVSEPKPSVEREILKTCLEVEKDLQQRIEDKALKRDPARQYFYKLCQQEREAGAECVISDAEVNCQPKSESSANSSFSSSSIKADIRKICHELQLSEVFGIDHEDTQHSMVRRGTFDVTHHQTVHFHSSAGSTKI